MSVIDLQQVKNRWNSEARYLRVVREALLIQPRLQHAVLDEYEICIGTVIR